MRCGRHGSGDHYRTGRGFRLIGTILTRNICKVGLVALAILSGTPQIVRRSASFFDGGLQAGNLLAFCALLLLAVTALFGAAFIRSGWIRWPLAILLVIAGGFVATFEQAVGGFMTYDAFVTMLASSGDFGAAVAQHGGNMLLTTLISAVLLAGIGLSPRAERSQIQAVRYLAIPILLAITALLFLRGGNGAGGLPTSVTGTAYTLLFGYEALTAATTEREDVTFEPAEPKADKDIVLIVDESIAGAYLDINDPAGVRSGLADADTDAAIHDFGLAAAVTNCSIGANAVLRYGGTRDSYLDRLRRGPSIWAFARKAGLETVYLDAQRTDGAFQNMMDEAESGEIDRWEQFDDISVLHRDHHAADRLAQLLEDGTAQFILVNKIGAHFPVSDKFPDTHAHYQPMLERKSLVVSEAAADDMDGTQASWRLYRNSYRNTLLWNVGGFFDRLFETASIDEATIIYTSDHGQSFHLRGEYSEATHCSPDPQMEEGVVPLAVIGGSADWREKFATAAERNHDAMSNYRIFPTVLALMGYRERDIRTEYGPGLTSNAPDPFTFNVNFNARLGSSAKWKPVVLEELQRPPESDY